MLHNETRELLVQGYEATHDAEGISKAYSASERTVYRIVSQKCKTGSTALQVSHWGRKPVLSEEDRENIRRCIDEQPDIAIREEFNLSPSYSTLERAINAMGYILKKKSLYASEHDRVRCAGKAQGRKHYFRPFDQVTLL